MKNSPRLIRVWTGDADERKNKAGLRGQRVYATREAQCLPFGAVAPPPPPGSWELVTDKPVEFRGGRMYFPEFELEPTARERGRVKFYAIVPYGRGGRELQGKEGNTFVLPRHLGRRVHLGEVFGHTITYWPHINPR